MGKHIPFREPLWWWFYRWLLGGIALCMLCFSLSYFFLLIASDFSRMAVEEQRSVRIQEEINKNESSRVDKKLKEILGRD